MERRRIPSEDPHSTVGDDHDSSEQRFDREAAQRILRRAAEDQARMDSEEAASYSLAQLQQIATEVGISSEAVVAAAEQARTSGSRRRWLRLAILIAVGVALLGFLLPATGLAPLLIALIGVVFGLILLFFLLGLVPL